MNGRTVVTLVGWLWVGLGVLMCFSGTMGFLASLIADIEPPEYMRFAPMDFVWRHYRALAAGQVCLAVLLALSGWMLVRRRAWARIVIQLWSILILTWIVLFGIYWLKSLNTIASSPGLSPAASGVLRLFMSVGGIIVMLLFASIFIANIWVLNKPAVRDELRSRRVA